MEEKKLISLLKERLAKKRYKHTIAVANTAEKIAQNLMAKGKIPSNDNYDEIFNCDDNKLFLKKVRKAALLHDYAKSIPIEELKKIADKIKDDWQIDREELAIPQVLHAPVAAYLVKKELGIVDQEILAAIRYHTIGSAKMALVGKIVFVADFIEPNRDFSAADQVRTELEKNGLDQAIIEICSFTIKYNIELKREIHPNTVLLRNACLRRQT